MTVAEAELNPGDYLRPQRMMTSRHGKIRIGVPPREFHSPQLLEVNIPVTVDKMLVFLDWAYGEPVHVVPDTIDKWLSLGCVELESAVVLECSSFLFAWEEAVTRILDVAPRVTLGLLPFLKPWKEGFGRIWARAIEALGQAGAPYVLKEFE